MSELHRNAAKMQADTDSRFSDWLTFSLCYIAMLSYFTNSIYYHKTPFIVIKCTHSET